MKQSYVAPALSAFGTVQELTGKLGLSNVGDTEFTTDAAGNNIEVGFLGSQDTCEVDGNEVPTNENCPL